MANVNRRISKEHPTECHTHKCNTGNGNVIQGTGLVSPQTKSGVDLQKPLRFADGLQFPIKLHTPTDDTTSFRYDITKHLRVMEWSAAEAPMD